MENNKAWYKSKAVWGGLIAVAAGIAGVFGYTIGAESQMALTDGLTAIIGAVGGLIAVYGRIKADSKVTK